MHSRIALITAATFGGLFLGSTSSAQIYVDPVNGSPTGTGAPGSPVDTITLAVTLLTGSNDEIRLMDGVYDAASGETFPIVVPNSVASVRFIGETLGGARVRRPFNSGQPALDTVFRIECDNATFQRFNVNTGYRAIQYLPDFGGMLEVSDMYLQSGFRAIAAIANEASINVQDSRIIGADAGIRMKTTTGGIALTVESTRISGLRGIYSETVSGNASASIVAGGVTIANSTQGIVTTGRGTTSVSLYGCTFHKNGTFTIPQSSTVGALIDLGTSNPYEVYNCIFDQSVAQNDFPAFDTNDVLTHCIVSQANLIPLTGNFNADPMFVDAAGGDFHLLPGSPAIDTGSGAGFFFLDDMDGEPQGTDCGTDSFDIGADEFVQDYIYLTTNLRVGQTSLARVSGAPGDSFTVAYSLPADTNGNGSLGPVPALCSGYFSSNFQTLGSGTIMPNGIGELAISVPANPALSGTEIWLGAALSSSTLLYLTKNVGDEVIRP